MTDRAGFFVVLEGPEGAGKSTLATRIEARARRIGIEVVRVREPGGTPLAEAARRALLDDVEPVSAEAELFLILAARADLVRRVIRPALEANQFVLADRYDLSTEAYQVAGRGLDPAMVRAANAAATGGLAADLTLILDVTADVGAGRQLAAGKQRDRLDRESLDFHRRVAAAYLAVEGRAVRHFDASGSPDEVEALGWRALTEADPARFTSAMQG